MKPFILPLIVLLSAASFSNCSTCDEDLYKNYLTTWNRSADAQKSANTTLYNQHLSVYCIHKKEIDDQNALNLSYTVKQYRWMDKTAQELAELININNIPVNFAAVSSSADNLISVSSVPPASVDYRSTGKVSTIKDQGTCGCCWSFTVTGLYQSWMMLKGQSQYDLSEEYILQCTNAYTKNVLGQNYQSTCRGGYVDFSGDLARRNGIPLESAYPYLGHSFTGVMPSTNGICETNITYMYARDPTVTTFTVSKNLTNTQMKTLIANGPVGALIYANAGFQAYSSGIYTGCPAFSSSYSSINHAVIIVGYDSSGNYIIKNSWATTWGQSGFGIVSKDFDCGLSAFVYQYSSNAAAGGGLLFHNQVSLKGGAMHISMCIMAIMVLLSLFL